MDARARHAPCHHCGSVIDATPVLARVDGIEQPFCCSGCAAAARWIDDAALGDYYRLRQADGARVDADVPDFAAWDRADVQSAHVREVGGAREITVLAGGMRCAACAWLIDRALLRQAGVLEVSANAVTGRIRLRWDPARTALSPLLERLASLGYPPYLATGAAREAARRDERRRWLLRLGVAGLGAMQAMMFAEALYLDTAHEMAPATRDFFRWIAFLVSTPVVFYAGWPFLAGMVREWRHRTLGMDTLVAMSTLLAYVGSLVETLRGGPHVWFDAAVMFVFLLLVARLLEQRARDIATAQVDALARARPALVTRERDGGGGTEQIPLEELRDGDVVRVADGEAVPADGEMLAPGAFDESLLTGESSPVARRAGDTVFAGSFSRGRTARLRVVARGTQTRLAQIVRLVEQAQSQRPAVARLADRVAAAFVAVLLVAATAVFAWWWQHDADRALPVTLALLVVSCPCALSLAVPTVLATAHGALARLGVLALREDAIARLARVDTAVFDKTGTLTQGLPRIESLALTGELTQDRALAIAAALERDSTHPLAQAFVAFDAGLVAADVVTWPGQGLEGSVAGSRWRLGRAAFATGRADDDAVWLGDGRQPVARFAISDRIRAGAESALQALRGDGIGVAIASGDAPGNVSRLAHKLGIVDWHARFTPEDKLAYVRRLQQRGHVVAMVGDGINDAPVLAGADVSIALSEGAAIAQGAASLVITGERLVALPRAIRVARRARRLLRQNLAWAVGYNVLALPLAAAGLIGPQWAALGMAASSLLVTGNALRLARRPT